MTLVRERFSVLLVEDNPSDARLVRTAMAGSGAVYDVTTVERLEEAERLLTKQSVDAVLLDLSLPDATGLDTFTRLHARSPALPIVVLTGNDDEGLAVSALQVGAQDYLIKDRIDGRLLLRSLRYAIERARITYALRQREEWFRALVEHGAEVIAVLNAAGVVQYASPTIERVLGYRAEERVGQSLFELIHPDDLPVLRDAFRAVLGNPGTPLMLSVRELHADGTWRHIEGTGVNRLDDPAVRGIVLNYRDVTERDDLLEKLGRTQRLEAVSRLAGGLGNDFNNLLTAILGYTEVARTWLPEGQGGRQALDRIETAAERAAVLTRELLAFGRRQILQPAAVDLNRLLGNMRTVLARLLGDRIDLVIVPADTRDSVYVDPLQVEQVVLDLARRAHEAMPHGGTFRLATDAFEVMTSERGEEPMAPGRYVRLSIADTGRSLDAGARAVLFEPFAVRAGSGLGLAAAYGIVRQSGGHLRVSGTPGGGTTFAIFFPAMKPAAKVEPGATPDPAARLSTILIVEDDPAVRTLAHDLLTRLGYEVLCAESGEEALAIATDRGGDLALLLSDVTLPGISGATLAAHFTERFPRLKVVLMSGYVDPTTGQHPVSTADAFVQKPFTLAKLGRVVREVLGDSPAGI